PSCISSSSRWSRSLRRTTNDRGVSCSGWACNATLGKISSTPNCRQGTRCGATYCTGWMRPPGERSGADRASLLAFAREALTSSPEERLFGFHDAEERDAKQQRATPGGCVQRRSSEHE